MKLLLYCPKRKPHLYFANNLYTTINGKIIGECDFKVEEIKNNTTQLGLFTDTLNECELLKKSCLTKYDIFYYLNIGITSKKPSKRYAIHIENLSIFDKPITLDRVDKRKWIENEDMYSNLVCDSCMDFRIDACKNCPNHYEWIPVSKAPKNMMIVWDNCIKKVLISIPPEYLTKIINGVCTVLIKKKVLKDMMEND